MNRKQWLAGLLAGVAIFVWTSIAHMVLPLGEAGIEQIPNEKPLLDKMHETLGQTSGLYLFPSMEASMEKYAAKLAANPVGVLMYRPPGTRFMTARMLITEFLVDFIEALLAVFLLTRSRSWGFGGTVGFFALIGIAVALWTNTSYWNWYGFPAAYTASYIATQLIAFVLAGLIAAFMGVGRRAA